MTTERTLKLKGPLLRTFPMEASLRARATDAAEGAGDTWDVTVSTEAPVERYDWWTGKRFLEVLGHTRDEIVTDYFDAGAAVLEEHRGVQVGVEESFSVAEKKLRASIRFSRNPRGQEVETDVRDKIRRHISVGYEVQEYKLVSTDSKGMDTYRAVKWTPYEISLVGIPADLGAGVGRAKEGEREIVVPITGAEPKEGEVKIRMDEQPGDKPAGGAVVPMERAVQKPVEAEPGDHGQDVNLRSKSAADIFDMANANGLPEHAADWVRRNLAVGDVALEILKLRKTNGTAQPSAEQVLDGMSARDWSKYSWVDAILCAAGERKLGGLTLEVHNKLLAEAPEKYRSRGGILVPMRTRPSRSTRGALDTKTATAGAELVFDEPGEFIDMLRNTAQVIRRGATVMTGLTGNIAFPKQTGAITIYWVAENPGVDVTESEPTFGLVLLSPKTMQGTTSYSRQLLAQSPSSGVDIETIVRKDFAVGHALALDRAAIHGTGTNGEPLGVYQTTDVQTQAMGGAVTFAELVAMIGKVAAANALTGSLGGITTPGLAAKLMATLKDSVAGAAYMWEGTFDDGRVAGYPISATNQVSSLMSGLDATGGTEHGLVVGIWPELLIGMWGALEIIVDPYAQKKRGLIEVTSFQMADVAIRHPESFVVATGATLA